MSNETNDGSGNPDRPGTRTVRDAQLSDMTNVNADVHTKLGALPSGGLPVQPKR